MRYLVLPQLMAVNDVGGEAIGISAPGPYVPELEERGIRHVPLVSSTRGVDWKADLKTAGELWGVLRRERPDVLHTHNPKPGVYGRVVGRLAGVPLVINTVHGLYATDSDRWTKRALVYCLEAIASRFSHAELVQSREDHRFITRWRISSPDKTRWLGNGVDITRFDPSRFPPGERERVRAELGISTEALVVGMVGRLVAEKGYPELFQTAGTLGRGYEVVCIGPDDPDKNDALPRSLLDGAKERGVHFLGMRDDVDRLYSAMDVFVLPSHREGFPRAAMEAAAMALPIVATDIRGCREVVEHDRNGLLIPVSDPDALTKAILRLGSSPEMRRRMGEESRKKAMAEFDERRVVETVLETYGLADRHSGRRKGLDEARIVETFRYRVIKRTFDVATALPLLVALSPLMAVVAALVRLRLGRPVLFRQARPGRDGELFTLIKFRTMADTSRSDGSLLPDDERMTPLGGFLRSFSLDELPELVNVIRGEMSIVGPRPLLPRYLDRFSSRQARRHEVKPGLTGWAQVNGRNDMSWEEKLEMDVWYVENWSLQLDMRICLRTLKAVIRRTGVSQAGEATATEFMGTGTGEDA